MSNHKGLCRLRPDHEGPCTGVTEQRPSTPMEWALHESLNRRIDELERALTAEKLVSSVMQERAEKAEAEQDELRKLVNGCACGVSYHYCEAEVEALREAATTPAKYRDDWLAMKRRAEVAEKRIEVLEAAAKAVSDWELTVNTMGRRLTAAEHNMATMVARLDEFGQ